MTVPQRAQTFEQVGALGGRVADQLLLFHHVQGGQGGGAGHRVGAVGAALGTRRAAGHQGPAGGHGGQRVAAGQPLGGDQHVRLNVEMLVAPEPPGAPVAGLDFIGDQQDAVLVAALAQALHEALGGGVVAVFPLHRLDDHGGGVRGRGLGHQHVVQLAQAEVHGVVLAPAVAVAVREGAEADAGHQRLPAGAHLGGGGGHRGRRQGAAVKAAGEGDDIGPAGRLAGQTQGGLHRFAAGVGERHRVEVPGQMLVEPVGETQHIGVSDGGVLGVHQLADLIAGGFHHLGVAVAGGGNADARCEIQPATAFAVKQPASFAPFRADPAGLHQKWRQMIHGLLLHTRFPGEVRAGPAL